MFKTLLYCLLALILSASPLLAMEGYKSLKFGMSLEEVKKNKLCTWVDDETMQTQTSRVLYCFNLKFSGESILATAHFIDNKFLRLGLTLTYDELNHMLAALEKKYGIMSYTPSKENIKNFNNLPNQTLWYEFAGGAIFLRCTSNQFYKKSMLLIYTSPLFDKLFKEKRVNLLKDDL